MDGVFMRKRIRFLALVTILVLLVQYTGILRDKKRLSDGLIRLHVVAASDSREDQAVKLQVKDAVVSYVEEAMTHVMTLEEAKAWLEENLPDIQKAANAVLHKLGLSYEAEVTLAKEAFPVRHYDDFSLPSGVYHSLRICLGEARGQNWWCVVFPRLCLPAAGEDFRDVAAGGGFSESLTDTLTQKEGYRIRFFALDLLGKIENFFFRK